MQLTGAEIVIRCLQEETVQFVFGYPGGAVLNIYDEIFKQDKFKHVLVRHEQAAVHAADAYARATGKVGVVRVRLVPPHAGELRVFLGRGLRAEDDVDPRLQEPSWIA